MSAISHKRAEILAGAIALGEASHDERLAYRAHIATCARCLELGGEHELERTNALVRAARDAETWQPQLHGALLARVNVFPRRLVVSAAAVLAVCLAISVAAHLIAGAAASHFKMSLSDPPTLAIEGDRIVFERRSLREARRAAPVRQPRVYIVHRVEHVVMHAARNAAQAVQIQPTRADTRARESKHAGVERVSEVSSVVPIPEPTSAGPPARVVARGSSGALGETQDRSQSHVAQPIAFAATYTARDPIPEGGDGAIKPQYSDLARQERAEGTVAYEVTVAEDGTPTAVKIVASSGYPVLDNAVREAALRAHFKPAMLGGKPVAGIYRDAFTFRIDD